MFWLFGWLYGNHYTTSKAPTANAGGPYTALPGAAVAFSGSASTDPQGSVLTYAWNFGDSTIGSGVSPSHSYAAVGSYNISLTATDALGLSATATTTVTVAAQYPVANAGGPYTTSVRSPVTFNGTGSSDPQSQPLTYAWDFGDGTTGTGVQPSHFYATHGSYTATLTITDATTYSPATKEHAGKDGMTIGALCEAALPLSDNTAMNLLIASVGGPAGVTAFARTLGDLTTRLDRTETSLNEAIRETPGTQPHLMQLTSAINVSRTMCACIWREQ